LIDLANFAIYTLLEDVPYIYSSDSLEDEKEYEFATTFMVLESTYEEGQEGIVIYLENTSTSS